MNRIIKANINHVDYITDIVVNRLERFNKEFKFPKYKTNYESIRKHVATRVQNPKEEILYFLYVDSGDNPQGVMNILYGTGSIAELLFIEVSVQQNLDQVIGEFLKHLVTLSKDMGYQGIYTQTGSFDKTLEEYLSNLNSQIVMKHYHIDLKNPAI